VVARQQDDPTTTPDISTGADMIVTTNIPGKRGRAPRRPTGTTLWASIDVEWTKNYRIKNGNRPFCYSLVYVAVPSTAAPVDLDELPFPTPVCTSKTPTKPALCWRQPTTRCTPRVPRR